MYSFQMIDAIKDVEDGSNDHVLLSFGKIGADKFTMDVRHPLSIVQGFGIALSSLHSKTLVE